MGTWGAERLLLPRDWSACSFPAVSGYAVLLFAALGSCFIAFPGSPLLTAWCLIHINSIASLPNICSACACHPCLGKTITSHQCLCTFKCLFLFFLIIFLSDTFHSEALPHSNFPLSLSSFPGSLHPELCFFLATLLSLFPFFFYHCMIWLFFCFVSAISTCQFIFYFFPLSILVIPPPCCVLFLSLSELLQSFFFFCNTT